MGTAQSRGTQAIFFLNKLERRFPQSLQGSSLSTNFKFIFKRHSVNYRNCNDFFPLSFQCFSLSSPSGPVIRQNLHISAIKPKVICIKVAPYSFLSARALISKIPRWRKLSNSTPKSRTGSRSKMPTNMASKLLKFVYRKCCMDRLRFQNNLSAE